MNIKQFIKNIPSSAGALKSISNSIHTVGHKLYYKEKALCTHEEAQERLNICNNCPDDRFDRETKQCLDCGCYMPIKVYLAGEPCPRNFYLKKE